MIWYKKLYLGESIKQARWVRYQISYGKNPKGYYCITLPEQGQNLLDIYPSRWSWTDDLMGMTSGSLAWLRIKKKLLTLSEILLRMCMSIPVVLI